MWAFVWTVRYSFPCLKGKSLTTLVSFSLPLNTEIEHYDYGFDLSGCP